jgi:hypothetical protein
LFKVGDTVVHIEYSHSQFEIEGISISGKYYLKLPGRMDKHRHAKIPQPVDGRLLHKTENELASSRS